jgi:hypothetical protein
MTSDSTKNQEPSLRGVNIPVTFILFFILLFSAVFSLLIEITSIGDVVGKVLTPSGEVRITPAFLFILLALILFIILWGFIELFSHYINIDNELVVSLLKIIGSFGFIMLVSAGFLLELDLTLLIYPLALLFLYTLVLYVFSSSSGMFYTLDMVPKIKNLSSRVKALILLIFSILMLVRLVAFDFSTAIEFFEFTIPYLPFPDLFESLEFIITELYNSLRSLIVNIKLDILDPIMVLFAPLETLLIKLIVYGMILFRSMGDFVPKIDSSKVVAGADLQIKEVVTSGIPKVDYTVGYVEKIMSLEYWKTALGLLSIFFLEVFTLLIDGEMGINSNDFMDLTLAFCIWLIVVVIAFKRIILGNTR